MRARPRRIRPGLKRPPESGATPASKAAALGKRDHIPKDIQAQEAIKKLMFARRLVPGQKIVYRDLEESLGMSKTPITNALVRLEQEGLVVSRPNRGYFVKELAREEIRQLYEMRIKLEEVAIDLAIANQRDGDLRRWRVLLDRYNRHQDMTYDYDRFQMDVDLHAHLAEMGRNLFLTKALNQFFLSTWAILQTGYLARLIDRFSTEHELLFEAVRDRQGAKAKKITRVHHLAAMEMALQGVEG